MKKTVISIDYYPISHEGLKTWFKNYDVGYHL